MTRELFRASQPPPAPIGRNSIPVRVAHCLKEPVTRETLTVVLVDTFDQRDCGLMRHNAKLPQRSDIHIVQLTVAVFALSSQS